MRIQAQLSALKKRVHGKRNQSNSSYEILAAKAAVDKGWEKLGKISAWNLTKVRSKKEVIDEARTSGAKVHFASLMVICHLKTAGGKAPKI